MTTPVDAAVAPVAADAPPVGQSREQAGVTTPVDAPAVSGHTSAPNVPSPSELSASCDALRRAVSLRRQSLPPPPPSRQRPPLSPAPADVPAPGGMTSEVQSPPAADQPQSAQQAIDTLTQRLVVNPSQASEAAPIPGISSSPSTESAAEKASTPARSSATASGSEVSSRPATVTSGLLDASKDANLVPVSAAFAASVVMPAMSQAVTLPIAKLALVDAQPGKSEPLAARSPDSVAAKTKDRQVERTHCATCGGFHSSLDGPLHGCLTCGGQNCVPGQKPCYPPANECNTVLGAFCPTCTRTSAVPTRATSPSGCPRPTPRSSPTTPGLAP